LYKRQILREKPGNFQGMFFGFSLAFPGFFPSSLENF